MNKKNIDLMYYFWCGRYSPFSGREFKTFERMFIEDTDTWIEPSDAYYKYCNDEKICDMILEEFFLKNKTWTYNQWSCSCKSKKKEKVL